MKLYHYSKFPLDNLQTSRHTVKRTKEQIDKLEAFDKSIGRKYGYLDHISFFFDQIPEDIGSMYKGIDHPVWKVGTVLYEHVIETIGTEFAFDLYETPQLIQYADKNYDPSFKKPENKDKLIAYYKGEMELMESLGHYSPMGKSTAALMSAVRPFKGRIREFYLNTLETEEPEFLATMYAPGVPHVFFYPKYSMLKLREEPRKIVLL